MPIKSAKYRFVRAEGVAGFMSRNRVSTDALNALEQWRAKRPGRRYEVVGPDGEDDQLVAQLSLEDTDQDAGASMEAEGLKQGVEFEFLPEA